MPKQGCSIGTLPPEIISDILIDVIKSFDDDLRLKWRFPLLIRRVSKRFYDITTNTHSLWRYLHIHDILHPYLPNHIIHSGKISLEVDITFREDSTEDFQSWTEITDFIIPLCPRLATLAYYSPFHSEPIAEILKNPMPVLESLWISGVSESWVQVGFPGAQFPRLRSLGSAGLFSFETHMRLTESLEELDIRGEWAEEIQPTGKFWSLLPTNIRVLWIEPPMSSGVAPNSPVIHLPCLTELRFKEYCNRGELSILQLFDAPVLRTLAVKSIFEEGWEPDNLALTMDFPALTHLKWKSFPGFSLLNGIIRGCNALKSIEIKPRSPSAKPDPPISNFMTTLADDTTLVPLLENIWVHGASYPSLIRLVQARPCLKSVKVRYHKADPHATGERWAERREWLESQSAMQQPQVGVFAD